MMLCGMGKYGRVMTQYIGIVYDVIFLLLVLGAAEAGRRRGFASGLVSLIGSVAGIIGGTYGTRVWAGGIYDKYVASHVTDVVADTLEKTGGDLAQAIHALTFLPQSIQQKLIDTVSAASSNAVPQVVNALEPLFLPVIQAVVFLSVWIVVRVLCRMLGLPARYVVGYAAPQSLFAESDGGWQAVLQDDNAHAWAEVYLAGQGWTPLETTPGMVSELTEDQLAANANAVPTADDAETPLPAATPAPEADPTAPQARAFWWLLPLAAVLAALAVWAVLSKKLALHRLVFVLVLGFGLLYSFVLPPYAAPDEKYHINQSFTLACRWANDLSRDEWRMGKVPTTTSFRRVGDEDADLQDENTTVFTWEAFTSQLFTTTDQPFDSHQEYNELQTDQNPLLYVVSAAAVFLAYVLHFGFAPALLLGRLANLLLFAALAALAVKTAPFGKRVFTVAALLPMTLHLAASFSRDAVLLGLCFGFTALLLDAVYGQPTPKRMAALAVAGILLAPGKMVYLPLAALFVLVPAAALGHHAKAKKLGYLAACLALALVLNTGTLTGALGSPAADNAAAATEEPTDDARSAKNAPAEPDAAYEETICADNTMENYVRRLYYYTADTRDPAQSEVGFWVQALAEGDVTPAVLGQSFIFTTDKANSYTDAQAFYTMASYALLGTDVTTGNADAYLPYFAEGGAMQAYKQLFNLPTCVERFAALGLDVGTMDDRIPLDRETVAAEVEATRATRATKPPTPPATSCTTCLPPPCCLCAASCKTATITCARW